VWVYIGVGVYKQLTESNKRKMFAISLFLPEVLHINSSFDGCNQLYFVTKINHRLYIVQVSTSVAWVTAIED